MTHLSPTYLCSATDGVSQCRSVLDLQEHGNIDPEPCAPSDRLQEKKKGEFYMWRHPSFQHDMIYLPSKPKSWYYTWYPY
jgi:hypothetical protein